MIDINLHQAAEKDLKINRRKTIFKSSFFLSFSLLAIVLIAFAITKLYQKNLINEKDNISKMKANELASFDSDAINRLIDFKKRLDDTSFNLQNKTEPKEILDNIEQLMVKGVTLKSFKYDDSVDSLKMEIAADSFRLASSQMLSLKKSGLFGNVLIDNSRRNESGQAILELNATIKSE